MALQGESHRGNYFTNEVRGELAGSRIRCEQTRRARTRFL